jgi:hypothetical protein
MKKYIKNPYAERIRENGCIIRITNGNGINKVTISERIVTADDIEASNGRREMIEIFSGTNVYGE